MNVVWITADTVRLDAMGAYRGKAVRTPSLDGLVARSMKFNRHYAANFPTMPARADFLTGRWTMSFLFWEPLPKGQVVLPQLLAEVGMKTAAFIDTPFYIRNGMNYDRGFQTFCEVPYQSLLQNPEIRTLWRDEADRFAPRTFSEAMKWLERHCKEDFFLYIDVWDPHEPWDPPRYYTELYMPDYDGETVEPVYGYWQHERGFTEEKLKKAWASYLGEMTMVDTWIGHFMRHLENLNLMDNTAIIFTTDHGFYFGEHGGLFGKASRAVGADGYLVEPQLTESKDAYKVESEEWDRSPLYEELTHIPLLVYVPGTEPGVCEGLTSAVDIMPTVLDIVGQDIPSFVEGRSLLPILKGATDVGREYVVTTHQFLNSGERARSVDDTPRKMLVSSSTTVTSAEWALVYDVEPGMSELYHLPADPDQSKNVIAGHPDVALDLHARMVGLMRETKAPETAIAPRSELRF